MAGSPLAGLRAFEVRPAESYVAEGGVAGKAGFGIRGFCFGFAFSQGLLEGGDDGTGLFEVFGRDVLMVKRGLAVSCEAVLLLVVEGQ